MKFLESIKKQISSSAFVSDGKYERYRLLLIPFIVLVSAILVSVLVTVPQVFKLIDTFKTINELDQKKLFFQEKASGLEAINVEDYRKDLDTGLVALPVEKDIPGVMGEILFSLGGSGLHLNGITFSNSPLESEKVEEYAITIDASGTKSSLRNFLERVTLAPRLIKLTSINITNMSEDSLDARVIFATFYQTLPKSIGSIDDQLPEIGKEETQILKDIETKKRLFPKASPGTSGSSKGKLNPFSP